MDSNSMAQAMAMMKDMPPEQLQRMMSSMGNITPDMMAQAQQMASKMGPQDWAQAKEQMQGMTPEQMQKQASMASSQFAAQHKYTLTASQQLKNEGNQLHSAAKWDEAIAKYERAKSNVLEHTSAEAAELRKACTLNLSSCYLNMKEWSQCIAQCNEVLAGEPDSLKALYRRGQAYLGIQGLAQAVEDLGKAVKLSSHDPAQQKLIKEKLQEAKDQLSVQRASGVAPPSLPDLPTSSQQVTPAPSSSAPARPAQPTPPPVASTSAPTPPHMDPKMLKDMAGMMRSNPDWAKQAERMYRDMSDDQLRELSRTMGHEVTREALNASMANGMPDPEQLERMAQLQQMQQSIPGLGPGAQLTPELMQSAAEAFKNMKPKELKAMTEMAAKMMPSSSPSPSSAPTLTASGPTTTSSQAVTAAPSSSLQPAIAGGSSQPAMPQLTPEMAKMAAEMMSSMSPEQLSSITSSMGGGAGGAAGMPAITPEMAKMAADMMGKMSPEDMQRMSEMMGKGGGMPGGMPPGFNGAMPPGFPGAPGAGPGGMPSADMLSNMDPKMMESAMNMMRSMDPKAMASMLMSTGMVKSEAQAEQMAKQMGSMSDSQMKMMMKAANVMQSGAKALKKTKDFMSSRTMLYIGLAILLLAVVLRVFFNW